MVTAEVHEQIIAERDFWASIAQERLVTLEKLKADRNADTIRAAGRLMQLAWILMILMVVFTGTIVLAGALRASSRECPPAQAEQPRLERP